MLHVAYITLYQRLELKFHLESTLNGLYKYLYHQMEFDYQYNIKENHLSNVLANMQNPTHFRELI